MAAASEIHLFKKSAIEAGKPDNYYMDPSMRVMRMPASAWSAVEDESFINVTINHGCFGDQVFVTVQEGFIHMDVTKENKKKAARFGIKAGMNNLKIGINYNFVSSKYLLYMSEGSTKVMIPKDKYHNGVFQFNGVTITC